VVGGRSAGARVACRTASDVGADGVLCLAFPLHPPGKPERSRAEELRRPLAAGLPVLVVQGERDAFGGPEEVAAATASAAGVDRLRLEPVPGSHSPSPDLARVRELSRDWLADRRLSPSPPG
ncbi:alpha/beta family hydrolase, partial [Ornithinicoccus halotolerans]|uniref:alpha/beta family hydrolase n=1 Tax=Ornithinicoccus halotolerans TaxID=1748220 RepID=UPI002B208BA8